MLTLGSSEIRIINAWSEKAQTSPFPQESSVVSRLKRNPFASPMMFSKKELQVVLHWAEQDTRGHSIGERYLLEPEAELIGKIEKFINE